MQIVGPRGHVVSWAPGSSVETALITDLCDRLKVKGVGVFKTEAKTLAAVDEAFREMLYDLKAKV